MSSVEAMNNNTEDVVSYLRDTAIESTRGSKRKKKDENQPSPLQALIIGIDEYKSKRIQNLEGAVADANDMDSYLRSVLEVPDAQIVNLRNKDATRETILRQLQALPHRRRVLHDGSLVPARKGDPFLIYFAGHGTSAKVPDGWVTETNKISMLVPYDGSPGGDDEEPATRNIPDRTIGALLHELAEKKRKDDRGREIDSGKGNNITVILDCCHSGSGTRHPDEPLSPCLERGFDLDQDVVIPATFDEDYWSMMYRDRATGVPSGFGHFGTRSHVPLAACRESEKARESERVYGETHSRRGMFTKMLLEELRKVKPQMITYRALMQRIPEIPHQTPQCEGFHSERLLFDALAPSTERIVYEVSRTGDKYILGAGSLHGVTEGASFSIHLSRDFNGANSSLGTMQAIAVDPFSTELSRASGTILPAPASSQYFALQKTMGESEALWLHIMISPSNELQSVLTALAEEIQLHHRAGAPLIQLGDEAQAHLSVRERQGCLEFLIRDSLITNYRLDRLNQLVQPKIGDVQDVLRAASRFFWHLHRSSNERMLRAGTRVSVHKVEVDMEETGRRMDLLTRYKTASDDLGPSGVVNLEADNKTAYGMTVFNDYDVSLYVWAFYFDCSDLSISEYYRPPDYNPMARGEAPLPAKGQLPIGYGSGGARPFKYFLRKDSDQTLDVGFIKMFISTKRFELGGIAQSSPFEESKEARQTKLLEPPVTETWDTALIAVVQHRPVAAT